MSRTTTTTTTKELKEAYQELDITKGQVERLLLERNETGRIIEVLKSAGFITNKNVNQARAVLAPLED